MKYKKINCELSYKLFYADISLPYCMGADHTMFIVLYNIMSFTYASKNSADTSEVSTTISKTNMHLSVLSR